MSDEKEKEYFSAAEVKLLITSRLKYEREFSSGKKSRSFLWGRILSEKQEEAPHLKFDKTQIHRKFLNVMITYKRIKNGNKKTGRNATYWEHFDQLDEVYGTKHSIEPPPENLRSTLQSAALHPSLDVSHESVLHTQARDTSSVVENEDDDEDIPFYPRSQPGPVRRVPTRCRKTKDCETLDFLKEEAKKEEKRFEEVMELERQKLYTERERIQEMRDLKDILRQMLGNSQPNYFVIPELSELVFLFMKFYKSFL